MAAKDQDVFPVLVGLRVVRGPDWEWGEQDGGEGCVGTVVEVGEAVNVEGGRPVVVQWDCGEKCRYRCGVEGKYDLRVLDSAPTGLYFSGIRCYGCREDGIKGLQWICMICPDYHLCTHCYMMGVHSLQHKFRCIISKTEKKHQVISRFGLRKVVSKGLFPGANVMRGCDWRWQDQDGGPGRVGRVIKLADWKKMTYRSVVEVEWEATGRRNLYRVGHKAKVDLVCCSPGEGNTFYPEHLPVLGGRLRCPKARDLAAGDMVKCELDMECLNSAGIADVEDLSQQISMFLDSVGVINKLLGSGELVVRYPNNSLHTVDSSMATKVDIPLYKKGDVVRIIDNMREMARLQEGHGGWRDDMALSLGQVGVIVRTQKNRDIVVTTSGLKWILNPLCVRPAPEATPPKFNYDSLLTSMGRLDINSDLGFLAAVQAGEELRIRKFLESNPHMVNVVCREKTPLQVAIEEDHVTVVRTLLEFGADMNLLNTSERGALHICAYTDSVDTAKVLLEAGADVNAGGDKGNTPLMIAGAVGSYKVLKSLASHPTTVINQTDIQESTALNHSVRTHRSLSVAILMDHGADPASYNLNGRNSLHDAAAYDNLVAMEEFVRACPDKLMTKTAGDDHTPLHIAAIQNSYDTLECLCRQPGVNVSFQGHLLRTALHCAVIEGNSRIIETLVGHGIEINAEDAGTNTALHIVFMKKLAKPFDDDLTPQISKVKKELIQIMKNTSVSNYIVLACFLVQEGANINLRSQHVGKTALQLCPQEFQSALMNFTNKEACFHGSLKQAPVADVVVAEAAANDGSQLPPNSQIMDSLSSFQQPPQTPSPSLPLSEALLSAHGPSPVLPPTFGNSESSTSTPLLPLSVQHHSTDRQEDPQLPRHRDDPPPISGELNLLTPPSEPHRDNPSPPGPPPPPLDPNLPSGKTSESTEVEQDVSVELNVFDQTSKSQDFSKGKNISIAEGVKSSLSQPCLTVQEPLTRTTTVEEYSSTKLAHLQKLGGLSENSSSLFSHTLGDPNKHSQHLFEKGKTVISGSTTDSGHGSPELCVVCEEGSRVRFEPCGHMVLCAECSVNIKRCPTCREKVERKITVT